MSNKGLINVSESEFYDRLLALYASRINEMKKHPASEGLRIIIKGNLLSDESGRYTVSVDAGVVYKFMVDPKL